MNVVLGAVFAILLVTGLTITVANICTEVASSKITGVKYLKCITGLGILGFLVWLCTL